MDIENICINDENKILVLKGIALASLTTLSKENEELMNYKMNFRINQNQNYFFIKENNIIIGIICIGLNNNVVMINDFAIFEKYQNKGFGRKTLNCILEKYKNFNIELGAEKYNFRALHLYTSVGFKILKEFEHSYHLRITN